MYGWISILDKAGVGHAYAVLKPKCTWEPLIWTNVNEIAFYLLQNNIKT